MTTQPDLNHGTEYKKEQENNERVFKALMKTLRPDLFVLLDLLEVSHVNPLVVWKTLRQISNVANGTGYGKVQIVLCEGKVAYIEGVDTDKVDLPALIKEGEII